MNQSHDNNAHPSTSNGGLQPSAGSWHHWLPLASSLLFFLYAINYLYFFVDDEGITFTYAQHLLRGQGLTYSLFEGPTEGYSNFLHVFVDAGILALVNAFGLPKILVFAFGKALSLLCGVALIYMVGRALGTLLPGEWRSQVGGLSLIALAGPLAVWSCSSLETVPFAALFTAFALTIVFLPGWVRLAVVLGALTTLARTDGFVYAGAAGLGALIVGPEEYRRAIVMRIAIPLAAIFAVYTGWRWWYFGSVLSLPLQTKLLYKLLPQDGIVVNAPETSYLARFLDIYEPWIVVPLCAGWLAFSWWDRDRRAIALLITGGLLTAYVASIGDWMFGFRFFTTLFPFASLLAALTLSRLGRRTPALASVATFGVLAWTGFNAYEFIGAFRNADRLANWRSWWDDPSLEEARFFAPYYPLYRDVKDKIARGTSTVNNQAGFLPFMLDLQNLDDLGVTSRFFAALPTGDVTFTEVGRYHALTNRPPLRAGLRYLVHREPRYLISWRHLIANANGSRVPPELLGGHFRLVLESAFQVVYERTGPAPPFEPDDFVENIAHPARHRRASLRGSAVPRAAVRERLPFLTSESADYDLSDPLTVEVHLDGSPVYEIWIDRLSADKAVDITLTLHGAAGQPVFRDRVRVGPDMPLRYHREIDQGPAGAVFTLAATPANPGGARLTINDVRVLGQPPDLREHIEEEVFERPQPGRPRPVSSSPAAAPFHAALRLVPAPQ